MRITDNESLGGSLGRGMAAGLIGAGAMTAFQKLVEMPVTGRGDSYAPADLAEKLLPLSRKGGSDRDLPDVPHVSFAICAPTVRRPRRSGSRVLPVR